MKKGLILEGGAMRGLFSCGVCDAMMTEGIDFDGCIGVSAGAAFGCNYKSKQIGRALRYNTKYCNDKRFCSFSSLIKTGDMFGAEFCYETIPFELDIFDTQTFIENPMEFYTVATDAFTGKAYYHKCYDGLGDDLLHIRASASMPLVSRPVFIGGTPYLDGGIADSIPLSYFESIGYEKNIVILTQPRGYVKEKNKMLPIIRIALRKYPQLVDAMARRHEIYNETVEYIEKREAAGAVYVIRPEKPLPVGRIEHDPEKLRAVHAIGHRITTEKMEEIKDFLKE